VNSAVTLMTIMGAFMGSNMPQRMTCFHREWRCIIVLYYRFIKHCAT